MRHPGLAGALVGAAERLGAEGGIEVKLERPREVSHGDLATNLAMTLAGRLGRKPRDLAQALIAELDLPSLGLESAGIAGPGFINFKISRQFLFDRLREVCRAGHACSLG